MRCLGIFDSLVIILLRENHIYLISFSVCNAEYSIQSGFILHNAQSDLAYYSHRYIRMLTSKWTLKIHVLQVNLNGWFIRQIENLVLDEM